MLQPENSSPRETGSPVHEKSASEKRFTLTPRKADPEFVPPGHFYSPIPALSEVQESEQRIWQYPRELPGIDLNERRQLELFDAFLPLYGKEPFGFEKREGVRYYADNDFYPFGDAFVLFAMMRHLAPRRIIEVGSGFSSALMLDVNDLFFEGSIALTFVEPHPERLLSLLRPADKARSRLIRKRVQEVELAAFGELQGNDVLFIDSSHVSKVGSDVNYLLFEVLPALRPGVYVHIHDVFHPFENPRDWIYQGRAWNETYLLRAFLMYNRAFSVQFFNTYLVRFHLEAAKQLMPNCVKQLGGSIWLRKE